MAETGSNKKVANSLVALSSAAVLAVYAAGYVRTRAAADRFVLEAADRKPSARAQPDDHRSAALEPPARESSIPPTPVAAATASAPTPPLASAPRARVARTDTAPIVSKTDAQPPAVAVETVAGAPANTATAAPALAEPASPDVPGEPTNAAAALTPTASGATTPVVAPAAATAPVYKDGTYFGWGTSRHGDIQAAVVIEGGRIASATIARCLTRYSCSWIAALPPQVALRQSPDVDYVSGATQSTNAFYYAVVEALTKAR